MQKSESIQVEVVLVFGNHSTSPFLLEDFMQILQDGFDDSGVILKLSPDIVPNRKNIFIEHFITERYVEKAIKIKENFPETEYICIPTEIVTGKTFNDFSREDVSYWKRFVRLLMSQYLIKRSRDAFLFILRVMLRPVHQYFSEKMKQGRFYRSIYLDSHYSNLVYWKQRYAAFMQLEPHFKYIWSLSEFQFETYTRIIEKKKLRLLPLASFISEPKTKHFDDEQKDIDFMFTGVMTPHRREICNHLKGLGYKLYVGPPDLSPFLREHFLKRTKVSLDIRQSKIWAAPSPIRLKYLIEHGAVCVSEKSNLSCHEEKFVTLATNDKLIEACELQIKKGQFSKTGTEQLQRYTASLEEKRKAMRCLVKEVMD